MQSLFLVVKQRIMSHNGRKTEINYMNHSEKIPKIINL